MTDRRLLTPSAMAKMQQAMLEKPHSLSALAEVGDVAKSVATRYVRDLQSGHKPFVFIEEWAPDPRGYFTIALYRWGSAVDAVRPKKHESEAVRMRRARAEKKGGTK